MPNTDHLKRIEVHCYAGYRGEETPRWFRIGDHAVAVREIQDRWMGPDHRYFKVTGDDDALYILRHDVCGGFWELVFFKRR
ncbi:hypothetical protein [Desulfococcus multivorans]|jgi:hypothetical protein|uniref:Uncharacterized protein n=1 Tax=Desulfococcus multivorans DSM 2059 TaxID=1121405 RepID=S7TLH9_DESML|nr:hypothetical protein [Desulfococcus multivorans]AOY58717.1 conserved uncharacterized protein [Desulfococcus multivorans]AQV01001.1 hypothetical protein B2D07_09645 [Desulfococcus multivorans]EPR37731.1 hypothetical protein dsmv_3020 [Desulfococcus multivorans DSM 2059]MDX9817918.1 hypothetical protein [Desulfococcus multivorans]SJZ47038.1 hypothetical protein SAMN02745446_00640 [Desulfococcus multivorans DSM 2059]